MKTEKPTTLLSGLEKLVQDHCDHVVSVNGALLATDLRALVARYKEQPAPSKLSAIDEYLMQNWLVIIHDNDLSIGDRLQRLSSQINSLLDGEPADKYRPHQPRILQQDAHLEDDAIIAVARQYFREGANESPEALKALCRAVRHCARIAEPASSLPIDMILHCPSCGMQHVDAPDTSPDHAVCDRMCDCAAGHCDASPVAWTNPPHRSHLCHGCGHIWRPADVPTNGVAAITTQGKNDYPSTALRAQPSTHDAGVTPCCGGFSICQRACTPRGEFIANNARKDTPNFERMFMAACEDLGAISEELGLDPHDGGAEPIIEAIAALKQSLAQPDFDIQIGEGGSACMSLVQPVQEPFAWYKRSITGGIVFWIGSSDPGETSEPGKYKPLFESATQQPAQAAVPEGWQPIESAPKNGNEIIVFHPIAGVCAAFCPGDGFAWHCMDGQNTVIGAKSKTSIPRMTSFIKPPTHWMPLPAAPIVLQSTKGESDEQG